MNIGSRIRHLRLIRKLKIIDLADLSATSQPYISEIEKGKTIPSIDKLTKICEALGVTLSEFFSNTDDERVKESEVYFELVENIKQLTDKQQEGLLLFIKSMIDTP